jgi:hypothetical protein
VKKMFWTKPKSLASAQLALPPASPSATGENSVSSNPPPEVVSEAWLIQNVTVSGIEDYLVFLEDEPHRHFIRSETRRLFDYLEKQYQVYQSYNPTVRDATIPTASVLGSSGTGRSTEIWAFTQLQQGRTRLWIHNIHWENESILIVKMLPNNQMCSITTSNVQLVYDNLNNDDVDLVVFDGTFNNPILPNCCGEKIVHYSLLLWSPVGERSPRNLSLLSMGHGFLCGRIHLSRVSGSRGNSKSLANQRRNRKNVLLLGWFRSTILRVCE